MLDFNETKDDRVLEWQWHQLDHMQTISTLHTHTHPFNGPLFRDYPGEPVPER